MITMSLRFKKKQILALCAAFLIGAGALVTVRGYLEQRAVSQTGESTIQLRGKNPTVKTGEERIAFIAQFGWEVKADPVEVREVLIPQEFDDVFTKYNYLQKQQGYNLEKQQGKRCKRYTYEVTNYPGGIANVRVNLLIYKDKVVGGDVSTVSLDGFMHGFDIATATTWLSIPEATSPAQSTNLPTEGDAQQPDAATTGAVDDDTTTGTADETAEAGTPTSPAAEQTGGTGLSADLFPIAPSPEGEAAAANMKD